MSEMHPTIKNTEVAIVTATRYASIGDLRFLLAQKTLSVLYASGYQVVVIDDSSPEVRAELQKTGVAVISESKDEFKKTTLGGVRRQVFLAAFLQFPKAKAFLWIEPEKDFAAYVDAVTRPILDGQARVVVPARTLAGWDSYPEYQMHMEHVQNSASQMRTGKYLDVSFGPVAYSLDTVQRFVLKEWDGAPDTYIIQYLPTLIERMYPGSVHSVPVTFLYPEDQRVLEESDPAMCNKRVEQLKQALAAHEVFGTMPLRQ